MYVRSAPLSLSPGLWEGIDESGFTYKLFQINEDGQHYLFEASIGSTFKHISRLPFANNDIECTHLHCKITLPSNEEGYSRHLILSPYMDTDFKVLESTTGEDDKPILTTTYQLDIQKGQSTVRNFMDTYRGTIEELANAATNDIYGLWVGIMRINSGNELMSIEIYPNKKGRLVRFINGSSLTNQTDFNPEDIHEEGDVYTVDTSHPTFANSLVFTLPISNTLKGYTYSIYKGHSLEDATFLLYRVTN